MGTSTPNLDFYKPAIGETGWGTLVDGNFDTLDKLGQDEHIRHVHPDGDDANDGGSWANPKGTILGAYDSLPTEGGTVYIADGSFVGGEVAQQGIWIIGPADPSYASPPSGWRQQKSVDFIGVSTESTTQFGMPGAWFYGGTSTFAYDSTSKPCIWLAGTNKGIRFRNLYSQYVSCGIRLGISSDNTDRNCSTSSVWFENVSFATYNVGSPKVTPQPVVDVGYVFWVWWDHCAYQAYSAGTPESDTKAAMLFKPESGEDAPGLVFVRDCIFGGGGIRYHAIGGTSWSFNAENVTGEGLSEPVFEVVGTSNAGQVELNRVIQADPLTTDPAVRIADGIPASTVVWTDGESAAGPMIHLGRYEQSWTAETQTLAGRRAVGFGRDTRFVGNHDGARRTFGFSSVVSPNLADTDPANWSGKTGGATVTTGQLAPDGTTNAAKLSGASQLGKQVYRANVTFAVGEWIIAGCWVKGNGTSGISTGCVTLGFNPATKVTFADATHGVEMELPLYGDGEWQWVAGAKKVSAIDTQPSETIFELKCDSGKDRYYYAPVLLHIAASTLSDNEVGELLYSIKAWPDGAAQGQLAIMRDTNLQIPRGYIELGNMTAPSAPTAASGLMRLYVDTSGGKQRLMARFDSGAAVQVAVEP